MRVTDATQLNEQDDLERAFQLNDAWNAEIAIQRWEFEVALPERVLRLELSSDLE